MQSYSGLRGAVAFSLALSRLTEEGHEHLPDEELVLRRRMLTSITALVLFTVFVQVHVGGSVAPSVFVFACTKSLFLCASAIAVV